MLAEEAIVKNRLYPPRVYGTQFGKSSFHVLLSAGQKRPDLSVSRVASLGVNNEYLLQHHAAEFRVLKSDHSTTGILRNTIKAFALEKDDTH